MITLQSVKPVGEPMDVLEAKVHLHVDDTDSDTFISTLISEARSYAESITARQLVMATWALKLDAFPGSDGVILLPVAPVDSIVLITYTDEAEVVQTLDAGLYFLDRDSEPCRLVPAYGEEWPDTLDRILVVTVQFNAGYLQTFTVNATTNVITYTGPKAWANGDVVRLSNSGGTLPAGLSPVTNYYVISAAGSTFKLSATLGGAEIDITGAGTGTHYLGEIPEHVRQALKLLVSHTFEHREPAVVGTIVTDMPWSIDQLLLMERVNI